MGGRPGSKGNEAGTPRGDDSGGDATAWQSWVSLAIAIHGICIVVALAANFSPSPLQSRVLEILSPYVNGLSFHPAGTPFYMTHGTFLDVDWRLEWLPEGSDESDEAAWQVAFPSSANSISHRRQREVALLRELAAQQMETEAPGAASRAAQLTKALAYDLRMIQKLPAVSLRLRRHTLQAPEAVDSPDAESRDPDSSLYFDVVYRADIVVDGERVEIIGRTRAAEEAATREITP